MFLLYVTLFVLAFIQNMAFTWVSRARNSGDILYHGMASICSNGIWFVMSVMIWNSLWKNLTDGAWHKVILTGLVYVIGTTCGAVVMHKICLKLEKGKRRVGST